MPKRPQELVPTAEAAVIFGVSVKTVNRWASDGVLPCAVKLPGRTGAKLFRRTDVERLAIKRERALAPKRKAGAA